MTEAQKNAPYGAISREEFGSGLGMNRGYSWLNVRTVDEEKRTIEGIATTPMQARDGDILETSGIKFNLPIPFLWRHKDPFGNVTHANVGADGIAVRIQVGAPGISAAIDEQWRMVKSGIVRGLSIGWRTLEESFDKKINGFRILKSEWLELSAVPVPADPNATITSVRSADEAILTALGRVNRTSTNGLSSKTSGVSDTKQRKRGDAMKDLRTELPEKIRKLEEERVPIAARMTAITERIELESRDMDKEEGPNYDADTEKLQEIDTKLNRHRAQLQALNGARPVNSDPTDGSRVPVVQVKDPEIPKGNRMARAVISMVRGYIEHKDPAELAMRHYRDTPEVAMFIRTVVAAGDTTTSGWASELVPAAQGMLNEFYDMLRPATFVGRMEKLRRVPFNTSVPLVSAGGTYGWVGESAPKPVTSLTTGNVTLRWAKIAAIIVISKELAKFSSPSAEGIIRNDMINGVAKFIDEQFTDPTVAAVSNVSPASITNGISALTPTGTTPGDLAYDLGRLLGNFATNNQDISNAVFLMNANQAGMAALMTSTLGVPLFPTINASGGSFAGVPVLVSNSVGTRIILVNAQEILFADDGAVTIDVSEQATVEMNTAPIYGEASPPTGAVLHSLWQRNEIGLRVERFITWTRARTSAVEYIATPAYVPTHT